jgi:hypothetical protein
MPQLPLTIEQQRLLLRRREEGWKAAADSQISAARLRTDAEKWAFADRLLSDWENAQKRQPEISGLVEQQRLFMKAHRR